MVAVSSPAGLIIAVLNAAFPCHLLVSQIQFPSCQLILLRRCGHHASTPLPIPNAHAQFLNLFSIQNLMLTGLLLLPSTEGTQSYYLASKFLFSLPLVSLLKPGSRSYIYLYLKVKCKS